MDFKYIEIHINAHIKTVPLLLPFLRRKDGHILAFSAAAFFGGAFSERVLN